MSSSPFKFEEIQWHVYELEYTQDRVDYLEGEQIEITAYLAKHPEAKDELQPMLNIIMGKIDHYRWQAIEDSKQGIRQPYQEKGKGRPRKTAVVSSQQSDETSPAVSDLSLQTAQHGEPTDPDILNYNGVARLLGLKKTTVYKYKSQGIIPSHKTPTGGIYFVRSEVLDRWHRRDQPTTQQSEDVDDLLEQQEQQRRKHFRPSRERKKEERKKHITKWTSKEVAEGYNEMKKRIRR